ncbi:flavin reductase family protein [Streptomyces sp. NBC_01261]|uniref:flavin reductase family protein n=1 Tax=unclassified Streptomyces TaxID=2593676 RepID=UPI002E2B8E99|nr:MULTISPECIES: flavin reductase family protein [unclassified Streptomyces]
MADLALNLALARPPDPGEPLRDEPGPDTEHCLRLYAKLASGVTVVTTQGGDGRPTGMTVSSLTSLSARPPLLLACLRNGSHTLSAIGGQGVFAVNLLRDNQRSRAARFADPAVSPGERFREIPLRPVLGAPVFGDALGWSVCLVEDIRRYGDHSAVVGRVAVVQVASGRPLLWHDRRFGSLSGAGAGEGVSR